MQAVHVYDGGRTLLVGLGGALPSGACDLYTWRFDTASRMGCVSVNSDAAKPATGTDLPLYDPVPAADLAWLDQQIVSVGYISPGPVPAEVLAVCDRSDCHQIAANPVPPWNDLPGVMINAAGVTVVQRTDDSGVYLDGYGP